MVAANRKAKFWKEKNKTFEYCANPFFPEFSSAYSLWELIPDRNPYRDLPPTEASVTERMHHKRGGEKVGSADLQKKKPAQILLLHL